MVRKIIDHCKGSQIEYMNKTRTISRIIPELIFIYQIKKCLFYETVKNDVYEYNIIIVVKSS